MATTALTERTRVSSFVLVKWINNSNNLALELTPQAIHTACNPCAS